MVCPAMRYTFFAKRVPLLSGLRRAFFLCHEQKIQKFKALVSLNLFHLNIKNSSIKKAFRFRKALVLEGYVLYFLMTSEGCVPCHQWC